MDTVFSPRIGETLAPARHPRVKKAIDGWYFSTREGVAIGPFGSEELAVRGVEDYVAFAQAEARYYLEDVEAFVPDESELAQAEPELSQAAETEAAETALELFDRRRTDKIAAQTRSHRVFEHDGQFFFNVRGGGVIGPYPNREQAEEGVMDFVSYTLQVERAELAQLSASFKA